jgi:hypothetical protein
MHNLISLKHISMSSVSPQKQKRVQVNNFSEYSVSSCPSYQNLRFSTSPCHSHQKNQVSDSFSPSTDDLLSTKTNMMPIPVSDELGQ